MLTLSPDRTRRHAPVTPKADGSLNSRSSAAACPVMLPRSATRPAARVHTLTTSGAARRTNTTAPSGAALSGCSASTT